MNYEQLSLFDNEYLETFSHKNDLYSKVDELQRNPSYEGLRELQRLSSQHPDDEQLSQTVEELRATLKNNNKIKHLLSLKRRQDG